MNKIRPTGKNARNHVPQFAATIPDLADNSRANGFGAAPVKKMELDTHVVANATQFNRNQFYEGSYLDRNQTSDKY